VVGLKREKRHKQNRPAESRPTRGTIVVKQDVEITVCQKERPDTTVAGRAQDKIHPRRGKKRVQKGQSNTARKYKKKQKKKSRVRGNCANFQKRGQLSRAGDGERMGDGGTEKC